MTLSQLPLDQEDRPRYVHDCDICQFLGRHGDKDLYLHHTEKSAALGSSTVIARESDDPPDYQSGMSFSFGLNESLTEARHRAEQLGLLNYPVDEALHSIPPSNASSVEEFRQKAASHPLVRLANSLHKGEAAYEDFAELAQAYLEEQARRTGEHAPLRYIDWFQSKLSRAIELMAANGQADALKLWNYEFTERFEADLRGSEAPNSGAPV